MVDVQSNFHHDLAYQWAVILTNAPAPIIKQQLEMEGTAQLSQEFGLASPLHKTPLLRHESLILIPQDAQAMGHDDRRRAADTSPDQRPCA